MIVPPTEFIFQYDLDDNGLLYWMGSFGKRNIWQNPHHIQQVTVFASSIGAGKLDDFVGREAVNCRTINEYSAFMGVDLGKDRHFLPSMYTIRNRNCSQFVLLNWMFQASNDKVNW